jgi:hypothetical protein
LNISDPNKNQFLKSGEIKDGFINSELIPTLSEFKDRRFYLNRGCCGTKAAR